MEQPTLPSDAIFAGAMHYLEKLAIKGEEKIRVRRDANALAGCAVLAHHMRKLFSDHDVPYNELSDPLITIEETYIELYLSAANRNALVTRLNEIAASQAKVAPVPS